MTVACTLPGLTGDQGYVPRDSLTVQLAVIHSVVWSWKGASVQIHSVVMFEAQAERGRMSNMQSTYR